jgi:LacI family transcriptional regulator
VAKQVTLSDVAAAANVDLSTVSRVLRGGGRASDVTRQRIIDTAARLNFRPNAQGQFLATGISKTIGVLTLDAPATFTMPVLAGVNRALGRRDVATLLYDTNFDEHELRESVLKFHARSIDGLLVIGNGLMSRVQSVTEGFDVPVVYVFGVPDNDNDAWFLPDGVMAGRMAGEHLIGLGRRRIAHVTAARDLAAAQRAQGLREALSAAGLELALGQPLEGSWQREWGVEAAHRILDSGADIDAIFCGNDQIALGVYGVLRAAGVRVPDDVALVGYDNWERMAEARQNLLTSIEPDLVGLGYEAATYLATVERGAVQSGPHYHPCSLVLGETTLGVGALSSADQEGWA